MVFGSTRKGSNGHLYQKPADGSGSEELLFESADGKRPDAWSPEGRFILYASGQNKRDLMVLPLAPDQKTTDRKPYAFLSTAFNEQQGVFSPDGKWVAYESNDVGRDGRFTIATELDSASTDPIHLLLNWHPPAK